MNQIFNEIDNDLKEDKFLNFFKKYKFIIVIIISLILLIIFIIVGKNIIFENRAKKNTQEYVIILNLIKDKKVDEAKKRLEILKDSKINLYKVLAISKLLELSKENKNEQILILDYAIKSDIEKIMSEVEASCIVTPLIKHPICKLFGSGMSFAVRSQGPIGANPRKDLAIEN